MEEGIVYFEPDRTEQYPHIARVEELLGGIGCLVFPDGTVQFAENDTYPTVVSSPRMTEPELEEFCKTHIGKYQAYFDAHSEALLECDPVPPIERFWEATE